jgi:UDP-2,3-diacylglucosamine pyrophosphatase LpxH
MQDKVHYSTLVLSDIHIGNSHSKTNEVIAFLNSISYDKLILNGDIIDGWQLQKNNVRWRKRYTRFFKTIMRLMEQQQTEIIYIRGNHDDFLDHFLPFQFSNFHIVKDYIHESNSKQRYYVLHGDVFDLVSSHIRWLAMLGDMGYSFLLWVNKIYNKQRRKKGLPYHSMAQIIKKKVKRAVSYLSDFEKELVKLAKHRKFDGIICGHIHQAENKWIDGIHYMNSGDWVESLTALAETTSGEWEIIRYEGLLDISPDSKEHELSVLSQLEM